MLESYLKKDSNSQNLPFRKSSNKENKSKYFLIKKQSDHNDNDNYYDIEYNKKQDEDLDNYEDSPEKFITSQEIQNSEHNDSYAEINELPTPNSQTNHELYYDNYEEIYLKEGQIKRNIASEDIFNNQNPNKEENEEILEENNENIDLLLLKQKIEDKLRQEYERKLEEREKELEECTKNEFDNAVNQLRNQVEINLKSEKRKLEEDFEKKWKERYETIISECKSKLREDKEKQLAQSLYHKLKPKVEKQIYQNELPRIEETLRLELEQKLKEEIEQKKQEELLKTMRSLEILTKEKIERFESEIRKKFKSDYSNDIQNEILKKEKEIKANYLLKMEKLKQKLEKESKETIKMKEKELLKELDAIKGRLYSQKCAEKIKLKNLSDIKKEMLSQEKKQLENAEKLEKAINKQKFVSIMDSSILNSKSFLNEKNRNESRINISITNKESGNVSRMNIKNKKDEVNEQESTLNNKSKIVELEELNSGNRGNGNSNAYNLNQINRNLRNTSTNVYKNNKEKALITSNGDLYPHTSRIGTGTLQDHFAMRLGEFSKRNDDQIPKHIIRKSKSPNKIQEKTKITTKVESNAIDVSNEDFKQDKPQKLEPKQKNFICSSLEDYSSNFKELEEFEKFLISHIEKEENYKILFDKEKKILKSKILSKFSKENLSDHCLLEYMIELWDKLEISFRKRYSILCELLTKKASDIYNFLDNETEILTDIFKKTEIIYNLIKNREKLKSKLQTKTNRNELTNDDISKFKLFTNDLQKKIKETELNHKLPIIWKGLNYEWLINYENWFYQHKKIFIK